MRVVPSRADRVVAGIAGGFGERLGIDPVFVRVAIVVLSFAGGTGVVLYALAWLLADEHGTAPAPRPATLQQAAGLGFITLGSMLLLREMGLWFGDALVWPIVLAAAGSSIIWARSSERDRLRWSQLASRVSGRPLQVPLSGKASRWRLLIGALLVAGGMVAFLAANDALVQAPGSPPASAGRGDVIGYAVLAFAVFLAGATLILGPWVWRLARQVSEERRERIRSDERAEMAAHLHDSVLQTLALIQRADTSREVASLARVQERELRAWLYGSVDSADDEKLSSAVEEMAARVERLHQVAVEAVVVGDAPLDERVRALVHASGEAATNAARHSGDTNISVYVEVEPDAVTAFITDRGCGFDVDAVPEGRRGIADSIRGRIERHGGTANVASVPGEGTEVQLQVPREAT